MVLSKVICQVFLSTVPADIELSLLDSVYEPVESHINCLASILFEDAIDDAIGSVVVCAWWGWWLWVSHFCQDVSYVYSFSGIDEECT